MFERFSDYALNKMNPDAIVYKSMSDIHILLRREDFSSEAEFQFWKKWSDDDYARREREGYNDDRCYKLNVERDTTGLSLEDEMIAALTKSEQEGCSAALSEKVRRCLTETQYRRMRLYYLEGKTESEIARLEGVGQQRVAASILAGKKKIRKNF